MKGRITVAVGFVTLAFVATLAPAQAADADPPGKAIYVAKCQACHGAKGRGDGPAAKALPKAPTDFGTAEFAAWATDDKLRTSIGAGKPGTAMRGFTMEDAQMADLVAYVKSLAPAKAP